MRRPCWTKGRSTRPPLLRAWAQVCLTQPARKRGRRVRVVDTAAFMPLLHSPLLGPLSLPKMAFSSPLPPGQQWSSSKTQVKGPHLQEALSGVPGRLQFPAHLALRSQGSSLSLQPSAWYRPRPSAKVKSKLVKVSEDRSSGCRGLPVSRIMGRSLPLAEPRRPHP